MLPFGRIVESPCSGKIRDGFIRSLSASGGSTALAVASVVDVR
jgi:hypothetical protein